MKYKYRLFLVIGFLLIASSPAAADKKDEARVTASVDKNYILIGEKIRYSIEITSREKLEAAFPKFEGGKIGEFEIKDSAGFVKKHFFGKRTIVRWYDITGYLPAKYTMPPVELQYREKGKLEWIKAATNQVAVTIGSVLDSEKGPTDIRDIKGPLYFHDVNWFLVLGIFAIFAVCLLIFIIYKIRTKTRPVRLPHETALEELEEIRGLLSKTQDIKEFYVRISDSIRHYIERVFGLKAPEMTTEEFLISLGDSRRLTLDQKDLLRVFLNACDLVKFAKYMPTRAEVDSVFVSAKNFVLETKDVFVTERKA